MFELHIKMENNKSNASGALLLEHVARILVRIYVQVYVHTVQYSQC
jgi:hypothetical protein